MAIPAYCTNVHAGADLESALRLLDEHATAVRSALVDSGDLDRDQPLPIGLWLPATSAEAVVADPSTLAGLRDFLAARHLAAITFNGFPFGDFHAPRVKHAVYRPAWWEPARSRYTERLALIAATLASPGEVRSISTLPIGWPSEPPVAALLDRAAAEIVQVLIACAGLRGMTGVTVRLDLEPEPGCIVQSGRDLEAFVESHLRPAASRAGLDERHLVEHVGACLDVCHAAVMFEPVEEFVAAVHRAGLRVGKVQVSSALRVDFGNGATGAGAADELAALTALRTFAEPRYLHQTMVRLPDGTLRFSDDLAAALDWIGPGRPPVGEHRVHFHVPVHLESIPGTDGRPLLTTTREHIVPALRACAADRPTIEVETYAWNVLPMPLRPARLADGIAEELRWTARAQAAIESERAQ